jgi:hypothetical protein
MNEEHWIRSEIERITIPIDINPERAVSRARIRARRRTTRIWALSALAVTAGTAGALATFGGADGTPVTADSASAAEEVGSEAPLEIDWRLADTESPLSDLGQPIISVDGAHYVISTTPGLRHEGIIEGEPLPQAVYRSVDGESWDVTEPAGDRTLSWLGTDGDALYAVSTAPGADGAETTVASSTDGGASWTDLAPLPEPGPGPTPPELFDDMSYQLALAVGDEAMIATRHGYAMIDHELLAEAVGAPANTMVEVIGDGYIVSGFTKPDPECVDSYHEDNADMFNEMSDEDADAILAESCGERSEISSGPLSDLGIDVDLTDNAFSSTEHFVSIDDGASWAPVQIGDRTDSMVQAVDGDLVATSPLDPPTSSGIEAHRSSDGVTWTEVAVPDGTISFHGTVGDRMLVSSFEIVGGSPSDEAAPDGAALEDDDIMYTAYLGTPGGEWQEIDLDALVGAQTGDSSMRLSAGPLGAIIAHHDGTSLTIATSTDGAAWTTFDAAEIGVEGDGYPYSSLVSADQFVVTIAHPDDGSTEPPDTWTLLGTPRR